VHSREKLFSSRIEKHVMLVDVAESAVRSKFYNFFSSQWFFAEKHWIIISGCESSSLEITDNDG